jgi:hypothetical protein
MRKFLKISDYYFLKSSSITAFSGYYGHYFCMRILSLGNNIFHHEICFKLQYWAITIKVPLFFYSEPETYRQHHHNPILYPFLINFYSHLLVNIPVFLPSGVPSDILQLFLKSSWIFLLKKSISAFALF